MPCALYCFKSVEIVDLFVNESIAWYLLCVCRRWFCTRKIPSWIFHLFVFVPLLLSGVYFFFFMHFLSRAHELSFCFFVFKGMNLLNLILFYLNFCLQKDNKSGTRDYEGQEVLRVRAYGSSFFTLGINIRYPLPIQL